MQRHKHQEPLRLNTPEHASAGTPPVSSRYTRAGKVRPMILLWALGVPIPIVIIIFLVRGCMG